MARLRRMERCHAILAIQVGLGLAASSAHAQTPDSGERAAADIAAARELSDQGREHFSQRRYEHAISDWRAAYALSAKPLLLYNLAQASRLKGDCAEALTYYRQFLETPFGSKSKERRIAEIWEPEMVRCSAQSAPPNPPEQAFGNSPKVSGPEPRLASAPPELHALDSAPRKSDPMTWVFFGGGLSALAVGGVFGVLSLNSNAAVERLCPSSRDCPDAALAAEKRRDREARVANVSLGVGLVGLAAATWLWLAGASAGPPAKASAIHAPLTVEVTGSELVLQSSF